MGRGDAALGLPHWRLTLPEQAHAELEVREGRDLCPCTRRALRPIGQDVVDNEARLLPHTQTCDTSIQARNHGTGAQSELETLSSVKDGAVSGEAANVGDANTVSGFCSWQVKARISGRVEHVSLLVKLLLVNEELAHELHRTLLADFEIDSLWPTLAGDKDHEGDHVLGFEALHINLVKKHVLVVPLLNLIAIDEAETFCNMVSNDLSPMAFVCDASDLH
mmetsp:Transcript_78183/g.167732  ORF Transcript_78183/g.167732 Transcript_78183/m.167732 type:complete len:221 (-) Transcript_78183:705-1367(-)